MCAIGLAVVLVLVLGGPTARAQDAAPFAPELAEASDDGANALASFEVFEGIDATLFAAEPLIANIVCLAIDEHGAVYVGETYRHSRGVMDIRSHREHLADDFACETVEQRVALMEVIRGSEAFQELADDHERVRLLRDTDGDGRADTSTVYADGFNAPAVGIGAGLLARHGEVLYTCIPELWSLRDTDGDDVADERTVLSEGYGVRIGFLGHDLHGLALGHDGRLYFSIGDRGLHVESDDGTLHLPNKGAVLRCELDGSGLELVHVGLRNPQELAFNDFGDLFTGDNNADNGDRARIVQIVEGADSGWRGPYQWVGGAGFWTSERRWETWHPEQPAFLLPPIDHLSAGPSGFAHDPGTGLDAALADHFFLCDFSGGASSSGVYAFDLAPEGAGYRMGEVEKLLWGLLATDCEFGPDGRMYVSDWVVSWDITGKGRIYTLSGSDPDAERAIDGRRSAQLLAAGMSDRASEELSTLLSNADRRVRLEAQLELAARGAEGLGLLARAARSGHEVAAPPTSAARWGTAPIASPLDADGNPPRLDRNDLPALHGIWGLGVLARKNSELRDTAIEALLDVASRHDNALRAQAIRTLGDLRAPSAASAIAAACVDWDPRVRFHAALAAGRLGDPAALENLLRLVADTGESDVMLRHAAVMGLQGCLDDGRLLELADDEDRHVRLAALLVMRRREHAALARFLDDPDPRLVHEAARTIYDVPVPDALPALAARIVIGPGGSSDPDRTWFDRFGTLEAEGDTKADTKADIGTGTGSETSADTDETTGAEHALDLDHTQLWRRALHAAHRLGGPEHAASLASFALRADVAVALRAEALQLLAVFEEPRPLDRLTGYSWPLEPRDAGFLPMIAADLTLLVTTDAPDDVIEAWTDLVVTLADDPPPLGALAPRVEEPLQLSPLCIEPLTRVFVDKARSPGTRLAAFDALVSLAVEPSYPTEALPQLVGRALDDPLSEIRAAGLSTLQALDPQAALPRLPALLAQGEIPERRVALQLLGEHDDAAAGALLVEQLQKLVQGVFPDELALDLELAAEQSDDAMVKSLLMLHRERGQVDEALAPWLATLHGGDADSGREIFERTEMQCVRCHEATENVVAVGPPLEGIGQRLTRLQLLESILDPNRRTAPGYAAERVSLTDGRTLSGRVVSEDATSLQIQDAQGVITDVELATIDVRQPSISAMPEGLAAGLDAREMRDLIEYVSQR